jgi:hypothetical protein
LCDFAILRLFSGGSMMMETQRFVSRFREEWLGSRLSRVGRALHDLVYSTADRLVGGDTHLAQDVTQTVFIDLARMARKLSGQAMLAAGCIGTPVLLPPL